MKLTRKTEHATRLLLILAHQEVKTGLQIPISIETMTTGTNLSKHFMEQVGRNLREAGLIAAVRGPSGGYILDKQVDDISMRDVMIAVKEDYKNAPKFNKSIKDTGSIKTADVKRFKFFLENVDYGLNRELNVTIGELMREVK